jgi:glycerol-3-phosphate dehydrogenase
LASATFRKMSGSALASTMKYLGVGDICVTCPSLS